MTTNLRQMYGMADHLRRRSDMTTYPQSWRRMETKPQLNVNDIKERQDDLTKEVELTASQRGNKLLR